MLTAHLLTPDLSLAIVLHYRATLIWHEQRFEFSCGGLQPTTHGSLLGQVIEAAGGLGGVDRLDRADAKVYRVRQILGALGGGNVGRAYDAVVGWLQSTF